MRRRGSVESERADPADRIALYSGAESRPIRLTTRRRQTGLFDEWYRAPATGEARLGTEGHSCTRFPANLARSQTNELKTLRISQLLSD